MVQEAEAAKESDAAAKRLIDLKNEADQYVYNTEKQIQEHSARIPQNIKDQIKADISAVNEAVVSDDSDKIEEALERLKNSSLEIGRSIYEQGNQDGGSDEAQQEETQEEEPQAEEAERSEDGEKKEEEKK